MILFYVQNHPGFVILTVTNSLLSLKQVSELWYKQVLSYDFDRPGFSTETLDFSQLVWMSSRKLGVGKAVGPEGVTVCYLKRKFGVTMHFPEVIKLQSGINAIHCFVFYCF